MRTSCRILRYLFGAALGVCLLATPVAAQTQISFEQITVSTSSVGFTSALITPAGQAQASVATCTSETADVRYTVDGTTPTSSVGMPWPSGTTVTFGGHDILARFRAIRSSGSDAKLNCSYTPGLTAGLQAINGSIVPPSTGGAAGSSVVIADPVTPTQKAAVNGSGQLSITCANCSGSGASAVDESAFTQGTNSVAPAGVLFKAAYTGLTTGQVGIWRGTTDGSGFVNLDKIQGTNADVNSGTKSAGTLRVVIATDQPQLTNKLLVTPDANSPINVAQINGVTPLMGAGNTGTGSPRMTIATDQPALAGMGVGATGAAPPANANYLGGIASGATGGLLGGVTACDSQAFLDMSTATTTELVPLVAGRKVHVCYWLLEANGTTTATFKRGTGSNCGTGTTTISPAWDLTAQSGFSGGAGIGEIFDNQTAANALCVANGAAVNLHIYVRYAVY